MPYFHCLLYYIVIDFVYYFCQLLPEIVVFMFYIILSFIKCNICKTKLQILENFILIWRRF